MRLALLAGLTGLAALAFQAVPDTSASAQQTTAQNDRQTRAVRTARTRPQIRVTPRYPYRRYHSPYPVPYEAEYPGPYGVRDCKVRYVKEFRPSGAVIVPRMQCWWVVRR